MGEWHLLVAWNPSHDGFHRCLGGDLAVDVYAFGCLGVIDGHQGLVKEPELRSDVPTFRIETRYKAVGGMFESGWAWTIQWSGLVGDTRIRYGHGYPTRQAAKDAAEAKATAYARAEVPIQTYDFTPDLNG